MGERHVRIEIADFVMRTFVFEHVTKGDKSMSEQEQNRNLWENRYHLGVDLIDDRHDKLFSIARRIVSIQDSGSGDTQFRRTFVGKEGIKFLKNYALQHFAEEEAYMKEINYPHLAAHRQEHDKFRDVVVPSLEQDLIASDYSQESVEALVAAVLAWLVNHIAQTDFAIVGRAKPFHYDAEAGRIEETVANVTMQMFAGLFDLQVRVLDSHYGGEDFGDVICYTRSYKSVETHQKIRFVSVISKEMSAYLSSMLLDQTALELSSLAASLMEEFSFMLMQHLDAILIPTAHTCKYADGVFFDREQFAQNMQAKMPEFSILFETNAGKFAICLDRTPLL